MGINNSKIKNVSIGIPAYNEEKNIQKLLQSLLKQKQSNFVIQEIIVACDGSKDKTVQKVKQMNNPKIKLLSDKERLGKSARLSQILKIFSADVLFLVDADIVIKDNYLFEKIIKNVSFPKVGLIGLAATPLPSSSVFQKIINTGVDAMNDISRHWNKGDNYLAFKGCFLGLDKKLAKKSKLDKSLVNNDAYFYFKALELGYAPKKINDLKVYYTSPKNFKDHLNQSSRYRNSQKELQKYFTSDLSTQYRTPASVSLMSTVRNFIKNPIYLPAYILIRLATKLARDKSISNLWDIAISTKK